MMYQETVGRSEFPMLCRRPTRAALAVVALAVIALLPTVALLGRLGLLTDPMVLAFLVLVLGSSPLGW